MHKVTINKLGPIAHVGLECRDFMVFTGAQASGKSTIAKTIFFFRTVKDDILSLIIKSALNAHVDKDTNLAGVFETGLKAKFIRVFGSLWEIDIDMSVEYQFNENTYVKIRLNEETTHPSPNHVLIEFSDNIHKMIQNNSHIKYSTSIPDAEIIAIKKELNQLFSDPFDSVYIPAGRSLITLLATQLNYIYSTMEDAQKRAIDYCTRSYLERILKIRPEFENGLQGLLIDNPAKAHQQKDTLDLANGLITAILKGSYSYHSGDERLELDHSRYVKINFISSGQQEVVWFLNLFFYHLLQNQPTFFIIEEPESNLFPESQKAVSEFIAFIKNAGNCMLVTTHSPYILGSLNNLLYPANIPPKAWEEAEKVIDRRFWINRKTFNALFVQDGGIISGMDDELMIIDNEKIDEISGVINNEYDRLFEIRINSEKAGE